MKSQLLLTTIAAVVLVGTAFADPIHRAAAKGDLVGVQAELDDGADVNVKDMLKGNHEATPLHFAALFGRKEVAVLLIKNGADVNVLDDLGSTPLHHALNGMRKEIAELLIKEGADVNIKAGAFFPLQIAIATGFKEIVELIIDKGADVNAKADNGFTSLHYAIFFREVEIIKILILAEANINAKTANAETPLDLAIENSRSEIIDLLINLGGKTGEELSHKPRLNFIRSPFGFTFNTVEGKTYIVESGISVDKRSKLREFKGTGSEVKFIDMRRIYFQKHFYRLKVFE